MNLDEAIAWLGTNYVLHPDYQPQPHHSNYARVDVAVTHMRVRHRLKKQRSFSEVVEQTRQRLRLVHGKAVA